MPEEQGQQQQQDGQGEGSQGQQQQQAPTWETWHAALGADARALIETHERGLKSALDSERSSRKDLERQLREAAGKLAKDSEERKRLDELSGRWTSRPGYRIRR